jgi:hypothetical protein
VPAGSTLETTTVDSDGKAIEAAGSKPLGFNALTRPFCIEGAERGERSCSRPRASAGNTLYLPVNVPEALLYFSDSHAGDGEIAGTAIEISARVRLLLDVIKKKAIVWPRFETPDYRAAVGAYRPMDDTIRIALTELVHWIHK